MNEPRALVEHFFRHEYGRLVAQLANKVGVRPVFMPQCLDVDQTVHLRSPRVASA